MIRNVVIIGAGAMGILLASQFDDCEKINLYLGSYGKRVKDLQKNRFYFNGKPYSFKILDLNSTDLIADLIIIAVKYKDLTDVIENCSNILGEKTIFISLLNGLDSEIKIGKKYGMEKVLYTVTVGMDAVREGYNVTCKNFGKIVFGELFNETYSENVIALKEAFDSANIKYEIPKDMKRTMWWKFMVNVGVNQTSAIFNAPYGDFQKSEYIRDIMEGLMNEVIILSKYEDVNLNYQTDLKEKWYSVLYSLSPEGKTSMLQDIEAKRKTEVEIFAGKVLELGKKYNIDTPYNKIVFQIIKGKEDIYLNKEVNNESGKCK
ncbi:MAG: ketopantoate reductase family protein [Deferribacterales bacterium]